MRKIVAVAALCLASPIGAIAAPFCMVIPNAAPDACTMTETNARTTRRGRTEAAM